MRLDAMVNDRNIKPTTYVFTSAQAPKPPRAPLPPLAPLAPPATPRNPGAPTQHPRHPANSRHPGDPEHSRPPRHPMHLKYPRHPMHPRNEPQASQAKKNTSNNRALVGRGGPEKSFLAIAHDTIRNRRKGNP